MADAGLRLPDFFIIGAQKSGTASLSALLTERADVFMSTPREPMFFCRDDIGAHPYVLLENPALWRSFDWKQRSSELLQGYSELFREARPDQLAGEGSTTYLVARDAPLRIASATPKAKLIALLRNPIDRAYSAYFHHLKNMRVVHSFEEQIKFEPRDMLETGNYLRHLQRYRRVFPSSQLLVIPFEQFTKEPQATYDRVCAFLGLEQAPIVQKAKKKNEALVPRSIVAQRWVNRGLRIVQSPLDTSVLRVEKGARNGPILARVAELALRGVGKLNQDHRKYPAMQASTRVLLRDYFARQNAGLSEFVGTDFSRWWLDFDRL